MLGPGFVYSGHARDFSVGIAIEGTPDFLCDGFELHAGRSPEFGHGPKMLCPFLLYLWTASITAQMSEQGKLLRSASLITAITLVSRVFGYFRDQRVAFLLGAGVEAGEDYLIIRPGDYTGAEIETYDDHRMAMSFAVAGLKIPGVRIKNPNCVEKSFPDFFQRFENL